MRRPGLAVLLVMAALATACGARLSPEQIVAASRTGARTAQTTVGGGGGPLTPGDGVTGSTLASDDPTGANGPGGGPGGPGGGPGGGGPGGPATTAPPGGNGGATDVGVTGTEIVVGNASTVGGPVPGLFRGAPEGTKAFAAYLNSQGGIHGRRLRVVTADDGLDANRHRVAVDELSKKTFAFLGMTSGVEHAGAPILKATNIPDIGLSLTRDRILLPNNFSPDPQRFDSIPLGAFEWFAQQFPGAEKKAAIFWHAQALSKDNGARFKQGMEKIGYEFVYTAETQPTEPNYTSHVLEMRRRDVDFIFTVMEVNSVARLVKAMQQQGFKVRVPNYGPQVYSQVYLRVAGTADEGTMVNVPHALFEDRAQLPEMDLFLSWMERTSPGTEPDFFALQGWAAGRMFEQAARAAGPELTRAKLLAELAKIDNFDANGLVAPAGPASKRPPHCFVVTTVRDGKWVRVEPATVGYNCQFDRFIPIG